MRIQAAGWLSDKARFVADGFRRQRLAVIQLGARTVSWAYVLSLWWLSIPLRNMWVRVDGWSILNGLPTLVYQSVQCGRRPMALSFDIFSLSDMYHGLHGFTKLPILSWVTLPGVNIYEEEKTLSSPSGTTKWSDWSNVVVQLLDMISFEEIKSYFSRLSINTHHASGCKNKRFSTQGLFSCFRISSFQQMLVLQ
jgi:hypothetical protein